MIRLEQDQITASADISHITQPGTYTIPYEVSLPNNQVSVKAGIPRPLKWWSTALSPRPFPSG